MRNKDAIARSKSINDIGKPPVERSEKNLSKYKVNDSLNFSNGLSVVTNLSNNTNSLEKMCDNALNEDDNGNRASVAEIRKRFDQSVPYKNSKRDLVIEGTGIRISDNVFKKQDVDGTTKLKTLHNDISTVVVGKKIEDGLIICNGHSMANRDKIADDKENQEKGLSFSNGVYDKRPTKFFKLELEHKSSKQSLDDTCNNKLLQTSDNSVKTEKLVDVIEASVDSSTQKCPVSDAKILEKCSKLNVLNEIDDNLQIDKENNADRQDLCRIFNRTNNFSSYITSRDLLQQGDAQFNEEAQMMSRNDSSIIHGSDMENRNFVSENSHYYQSSKVNNVSKPHFLLLIFLCKVCWCFCF